MRPPIRTALRPPAPIWQLLTVALLVSACGTKGPLVMPPKAAAAPVSTNQPAAANPAPIKAGDPSTQEKTAR